MTVRVTFKDEDEVDGVAIGPVRVIDVEALAADPVASGTMWPFGYKPAGVTDLGWMGKPEALAVARSHGVDLEEV